MAAAGMTNREIAQALFVTTKAIAGHLTHVYDKLDNAGRAQLPDAFGETNMPIPLVGLPAARSARVAGRYDDSSRGNRRHGHSACGFDPLQSRPPSASSACAT